MPPGDFFPLGRPSLSLRQRSMPDADHSAWSRRRGNFARSRRYLQPVFGCLRCKRRSVFAAAWTRYLEPVYAAELVDLKDVSRRQTPGALTTESDGGIGGRVAGSDVGSAGTCALQSQDPRSPTASRPGAQGRSRPGHRKRRGSSAVPGAGTGYGKRRSPRPYTRSAMSAGRCGGDMSTPQKHPPTRHYLKMTPDNRR